MHLIYDSSINIYWRDQRSKGMKKRMNRQTHAGTICLTVASICNIGLSSSVRSFSKTRFSERGRTQLKCIYLKRYWNCCFLGKGREGHHLSLVARFPLRHTVGWLFSGRSAIRHPIGLATASESFTGRKLLPLPIVRAVMGGISQRKPLSVWIPAPVGHITWVRRNFHCEILGLFATED